MAWLTQEPAAAETRAVVRACDTVLLSFAQIVLSQSRAAGLCVMAAAALRPATLVCASATLLGAWGTVRLTSMQASLRDGPYGCNAAFVGMGVGWAFGLTPGALGLAAALGVATVAVSAFVVVGAAKTLSLPVLSLPFVIVCELMMAAAPALGLPLDPQPPLQPAGGLAWIAAGLGGLVFDPRPAAGVIIAAAVLVHSRIGFSLAAVGALVAAVCLRFAAPAGGSAVTVALNATLAAMAVGGAWFVPSAASFALAALAAGLSVFLSLALQRPFAAAGLPLLVLPFNAAVTLVLCLAAQRTWGARPRAVDFIPGSPEQNLRYDRTRTARALGERALRLRLPVRGVWCCTQGFDGAYTHRGPWRHALDFEVRGPDGAFHAGDGRQAADYHCFRLPVLAAADGTVAAIQGDVPDNPIGTVNLQRNWGNLVVLQHAPGTYSLAAHLAQGSLAVRKGQVVRRGDLLGLCGNSGRSPRPHLHFQLQESEVPGAPTIPFRFEDACLHADDASGRAARLVTFAQPTVGESWSHPEPEPALVELFAEVIPASGHALFSVNGHPEELRFGVDVFGRQVVRDARDGTLFVARHEDRLSVLDVLAPADSFLHALRAALSRVPLVSQPAIRWRDVLPPATGRPDRWSLLRDVLRDFLAPFVPEGAIPMEYGFERQGDRLAIVGQAISGPSGRVPAVRTRAEVSAGIGLTEVLVATEARRWHAVRIVERVLAPPPLLPCDGRSLPDRAGRAVGVGPWS